MPKPYPQEFRDDVVKVAGTPTSCSRNHPTEPDPTNEHPAASITLPSSVGHAEKSTRSPKPPLAMVGPSSSPTSTRTPGDPTTTRPTWRTATASKSNSSPMSRRRPEPSTPNPLDIDQAGVDPTPLRYGTSDRSTSRCDPSDNPGAKRSHPCSSSGEVCGLLTRSTHRIITAVPASSTPHRLLPDGCTQSLRFVTLPA